MLNEGNKNERKANIMPKNVIDKLLILKGSSSSFSESLKLGPVEDSSIKSLDIKCFDFV